MAKLTQAQIKDKLDGWAQAHRQIEKAEAAKMAFLEPLIAKHDKKIDALRGKADIVEAEIEAWLNTQTRAVRVETQRAIAELSIADVARIGGRVIDVERFITTAKAQRKNPWPCIKVEVGKAEKLLGPKDIDAISTRSESIQTVRTATVSLKD